MEDESGIDDQFDEDYSCKLLSTMILPIKPLVFVTNLVSLQAEIFSNCISALASPFLSVASLLFNSLIRRPPPPLHKLDFNSSGGSYLVGKKIMAGLLAAVYAGAVLVGLLMAAAVLGVGLVTRLVEEPLYVTETLHFDYSDPHPTAVFNFPNNGGPVPVGHTLYVSLVLLIPESDYNIALGVFQLTAEVISTRGEVMGRASCPCMLQFRSWPIRAVRTFMMGVPLLLGITTETQRIMFPLILKHREEAYPRTQAVRITLIPHAGTLELPQIYNADIMVETRLPLMKGLVYRWKWTLYVWTSMYMFTLLLMVGALVFLGPLIINKTRQSTQQDEEYGDGNIQASSSSEEGMDRGLLRNRNIRNATLLHQGSCASSISLTREETGPNFEEEEGYGDSESVVS